GLLEERAVLVLERVQIQVKPEIGYRVAGRIAPDEPLLTGELPRRVIEPDADPVVDDPFGMIGQARTACLRMGGRLAGVERRAGNHERGRAPGKRVAHVTECK